MPRFEFGDDGVNVTRPATSWNASKSAGGLAWESPAVAAGTLSVTSTSACQPFGTHTCDGLTETVCGDPCWFVTATSKVAAGPSFLTRTVRFREKLSENSARPKLSVVSSQSANAKAIVPTAAAALTKPDPALRAA